jgi:hypothetical protein
MGEGVVLDATADGDHVHIERPNHRSVRFGVVKLMNVTSADIAHLFDGEVDFIVNTPRAGVFQRDAIELCWEEQVAWGALRDSMRAVRLDDPQTYVQPTHDFVMSALNRHSHVQSFSFMDSRRIHVIRKGGLPPLILYIEDTYQAEVTSVHFALDRCSSIDIFVATNPNAGPTTQAITAAEDAGLEILRWADTLSRLRR